MLKFKAKDFYCLNDRIVYIGSAPEDSVEFYGKDWLGKFWVLDGRVRKIRALETGLLNRPIQKGDTIGVIFEYLPLISEEAVALEKTYLAILNLYAHGTEIPIEIRAAAELYIGELALAIR